jgi:hypothetical protein
MVILMSFEVYKRHYKEKRMMELHMVLRFSDEQVLRDMENVIRAIEFFIVDQEKHTTPPRGSENVNEERF